MLIFSLQKAHLPLKKRYEITGILCHGFNLLPHFGHLDGGKTILSPLIERRITTLKKLPKHNPIINTHIRIYEFKYRLLTCNTYPSSVFKLPLSNFLRSESSIIIEDIILKACFILRVTLIGETIKALAISRLLISCL